MQHMGQKHGGLVLLGDSVGTTALAQLCTVRSQACRRWQSCGSDTPLRELRVWVHFPGQTTVRASGRSGPAGGQQLPQGSRPVPPDRDKQLLSELRRASAMALPQCVVSRYATAWAECLEEATSGHQSWAVLCRYRCRLLLAESSRGVDRNSELKLRLRLWEAEQISDMISEVLDQQNSGPLRRTARKTQPQTDEQRGKGA